MQMNNESGLFPPMAAAYSSVPRCGVKHVCSHPETEHFSRVTQTAFKLATPPTSVHIPLGA